MNMIDIFNKGVSDVINKHDSLYEAWFGKINYVPETIIIESSEFNCGALCNEFEFARLIGNYYIRSLNINIAEHDELESLINGFVDLPRRGSVESDSLYKLRFAFIVVANNVSKRTTKTAILNALKYFVGYEEGSARILEPFGSTNCYFQLRIKSVSPIDGILTFDDLNYGYLDNFYIGGPSIGTIGVFLTDLINRIKAAGVDFDIALIESFNYELVSNAIIYSLP